MLDGLLILQDKLKAFNFEEKIQFALLQNDDYIIQLIKNQLELGKDGDDNDVRLYNSLTYSPFTVEIKEKYGSGIGRITDVITNYMSGGFYDSLSFKILERDEFEVYSNSPLVDKIKSRSGQNIININKFSAALIQEKVQPIVQELIQQIFYDD